MKRIILGLLILAIGIMMFLRAMGIESFDWFFSFQWKVYILPAIVIVLGVLLVFHNVGGAHSDGMRKMKTSDAMDDNGFMKIEATLAGHKYKLKDENFTGAKIKAFMGGVTLDLRDANLSETSEINVSTLMGGLELFVPRDVLVDVSSSCVCGGVKNVKPVSANSSGKVLKVFAECLFGGVDIKY